MVILLHGDEHLLMEEVAAKIRSTCLNKKTIPFNLDVYHAPEASPSDVIRSSQTLPVMSEKRLVIVKGASRWNSKELEGFLPYLKDPVPTTCLLFISGKIDLRISFVKTVKSRGLCVQVRRLYEEEIRQWIQRRVEGREKQISSDAASFIVEHCGRELTSISSELEKVLLFCESNKRIDLEDVQEVISDTRVWTVFEFIDKLGRKEAVKALDILNRMIEEGVSPLGILGMVARQFRLIWRAKEILRKGGKRAEIGGKLKLAPFQTRPLLAQLNAFSEEELEQAFSILLQVDCALKSSRISRGGALEVMTMKLCGAFHADHF